MFGFGETNIQTGGASKFLKFILDEFIPHISSNYLTDPVERVFYGYSLGGLFGPYTLFHSPETLSKFLIGNLSIQYKNGGIYKSETEYA